MMRWVCLIALIACFSINSSAGGLKTAQVLYKSTTEQTVALDIGDLDEVKEGSYGKILIQRGTLDRPILFLVGLGKVVKTFPNKSVWLMQKNYIKDRMLVDERVIVLLDSYVRQGRENTYRQRQIVFSDNEYESVDDFLERNKNNVPDKFVSHYDEFDSTEELYKDEKIAETDREVQTYDTFKNAGSTHVNDDYNSEIKGLSFLVNKGVRIGDIKKKDDLELLEKDTNNLIRKMNSQKYGLKNGLYHDSTKSPISRDINDAITITSTYEKSKQEARTKNMISEEAIAKIKRDGDMWSADLNDQQLRRYFVKTGLWAEKERRETFINELEAHEIVLSYAGSVNTHVATAEIDPSYQNRGYQLNLGYDLHFSKINKDYKNWSMQFVIERGVNYYDINNINGRSEEGQYGAYLNYYFLNNPLTLHKFIGQIGLGVKFGMSSMTSDLITKTYDYQILTLPSIQLMTKYRFRAGDLNEDTANVGMSLNGGVVFESKSLKIVNNPSDNITSSISVNDIRYLFGVSFYF